MIGTVGTILGKDGVNIAEMSLSRLEPGDNAYMVVRCRQTNRARRPARKSNPTPPSRWPSLCSSEPEPLWYDS